MDAFCQVDYLRYPKVNRHAAKSIAIMFIHPVSLTEEFRGITNGHFGGLKHVGVDAKGSCTNPLRSLRTVRLSFMLLKAPSRALRLTSPSPWAKCA